MGTHLNEDLYTGIKLLPGNYFLENLKTVMALDYPRYYLNSFTIAVCNTVGAIMVSSLGGYAFAKYNFKGKKGLFTFVIATLAIPMQLGLVGYVLEMKSLGIVNTILPMIFSGMASGFGTFFMTQFIGTSVPNEILESGRIDGCTDYGIFFKLVFPIIRPAFITIGLLLFLWSWNSYMVPLVIVTRKECYTIPLSIAMISTEFRTDYAARILSLAISTIPIVGLFAFGSKYLIQGLTAGSVKG
jgi:multiple sugar transport system permease protein/cellobiose transport system permease protein